MAESYVIGLDLGQASDYTAVSVLAPVILPIVREESVTEYGSVWRKAVFRLADGSETTEHPPLTFAVRHLERWRGVPYSEIVSRVGTVARRLGAPDVVVDATGVGSAVVDILRGVDIPGRIVPVSIHGGEKVTRDGDAYRVPKRDLVAVVAVFLEAGRLAVARSLPLAETLVSELRTFRVKVDPSTSHESFAAWREKDHDDLVLSVALASWWAEHHVSPPQPRLLSGASDDTHRGL